MSYCLPKDLAKFANEDQPPSHHEVSRNSTLLGKYQIPLNHFEFKYIQCTTDAKELERIVKILRSGEEGHYPDLTKAAENRLMQIKPRSKLLRKITKVLDKIDLNGDEVKEISSDLQQWVNSISKNNRELNSRKTTVFSCEAAIRKPRSELTTTIPSNINQKLQDRRIESTNYEAWDKYDPDTEIMKMNLKDEALKKSALEVSKSTKSSFNLKKTVTFNKFATEAEAIFSADREREKGNEFFRAGEYEEALQYYNNSIFHKPSVLNLNNRAATYLKLNRNNKALEDCDRSLGIDPNNIKANLRKGKALEGLKRYEEALECAEFVIQKEPNNMIAQELASRVRKFCRNVLKNTKIKIVEIE